MAHAMKFGFKELYDANEYAHHLSNEKLAALVTQLTGAEKDARTTQCTVTTFANLKKFADFDKNPAKQVVSVALKPKVEEEPSHRPPPSSMQQPSNVDLKLSYTINLNLPESTNPDVFNAIFRSLKENLLSEKS